MDGWMPDRALHTMPAVPTSGSCVQDVSALNYTILGSVNCSKLRNSNVKHGISKTSNGSKTTNTVRQTYIHTYTRLTAVFPGLPGWASTRKVKPIWILLKQETVSGSGISWAICKSAPRSGQITTPAPHHSVFYRPDALVAAQPTASKHWRQLQFDRHGPVYINSLNNNIFAPEI